ncbi:hypothetical protein ABFO97_11420 [Acinetobacter baumannii]|uniref:hypothetical protein n=1 Tax=Acinetobacter baumannii TaxID=470 RepID=UPI00081984B3|nr:hypothetical protein [Acinetobacter baumannii]EIB7121062.1 hypothetical protein [Acinetobacter baumannii]EJB8478686.1 hypothetical protein [Acinetobacter baumannii]EKU3409348.1 hypothetical protein [Acinetobacter baumannii]MBD0495056.1 hypothetical protein [Acinetobacter baumannii]MCT9282233.1 DUF2345 domain-containing protein [Acinetobacter baumannii]
MAGGSQIIINKSGITVITPAKFKVKAVQHIFKGSAEVGVNLQGLPAYEKYDEKFNLFLPSGKPLTNVGYNIQSNNQNFMANTDLKGKTKRINTKEAEQLDVDLNWLNFEPEENDPVK